MDRPAAPRVVSLFQPHAMPRLALLRRVAAAAVLSAAASVPAHAAQCPIVTTLDEYLAPTFNCRMRSFTFSNFSLVNTIDHADNAIVTGVDPTLVNVLAYRPPIQPIPGFGFIFDGFANSVIVGSTTETDVFGQVTTVFGFDFTSTRRELTRAGFFADLLVDRGSRPGQLDASSSISALVDGPGATCLDVVRDRTNTGESTPAPINPCDPSAIVSGHATYTLVSTVVRSGGRRDIEGAAVTTLEAIDLHAQRVAVVTPEPATLALVGGGMLLLGVGARRRRR